MSKPRVAVVSLLVAGFIVTLGVSRLPTHAAPAPAEKPKPASGGVIVLDDCDPEYKGKATYADNLSFFASSSKLTARVSGLNICEEIGSPHRVAVDSGRKRVWVAETVGSRLLQYDLDGKEQLVIGDVPASALAVDPASGNVWVARSSGRIGGSFIEVYDRGGKHLKKHDITAFDLAYDPRAKAIWAVEKQLIKISLDGKILVQKDVTNWCAVSVAVNPKTGAVWAVTRHHSNDLGKNALMGFDSEGKQFHDIPLGDHTPFRVAVNPHDGSVWVANWGGSVLHYSAKGKKIAEHKLAALTLDIDPASDNVWVVTQTELLKVHPKGEILGRTPHKAKTTQAWIASY